MRKRFLLLLIILLVFPFSLAQTDDSGPVTRPAASTTVAGDTYNQLRTQNAEILLQVNSLGASIISEVNNNNDLNMEFIDGLFYEYVAESRKGIIVGVLGAGFLLGGILGMVNLRYNRKQYFVAAFKEKTEKLEKVVKEQKAELEAIKKQMKEAERNSKEQPTEPVLQQQQQYPQYPQPQQYPQPHPQQQPTQQYSQQGGNQNGPTY